MSLNIFHSDLTKHIESYLDDKSVLNLASTNSYFRQELHEKTGELAKQQFQKTYGTLGENENPWQTHCQIQNTFAMLASKDIQAPEGFLNISDYVQRMDVFYVNLLATPPLDMNHPLQDIRDRTQRFETYKQFRSSLNQVLSWSHNSKIPLPAGLSTLPNRKCIVGHVKTSDNQTTNILAYNERENDCFTGITRFSLEGADTQSFGLIGEHATNQTFDVNHNVKNTVYSNHDLLKTWWHASIVPLIVAIFSRENATNLKIGCCKGMPYFFAAGGFAGLENRGLNDINEARQNGEVYPRKDASHLSMHLKKTDSPISLQDGSKRITRFKTGVDIFGDIPTETYFTMNSDPVAKTNGRTWEEVLEENVVLYGEGPVLSTRY